MGSSFVVHEPQVLCKPAHNSKTWGNLLHFLEDLSSQPADCVLASAAKMSELLVVGKVGMPRSYPEVAKLHRVVRMSRHVSRSISIGMESRINGCTNKVDKYTKFSLRIQSAYPF